MLVAQLALLKVEDWPAPEGDMSESSRTVGSESEGGSLLPKLLLLQLLLLLLLQCLNAAAAAEERQSDVEHEVVGEVADYEADVTGAVEWKYGVEAEEAGGRERAAEEIALAHGVAVLVL